MTKPFRITFRHTDHTQDPPVLGSIEDAAALFRSTAWDAAFREHDDRKAFPELKIERVSDADLLALEFLGPSGLFLCTTIIEIPKKVLGLKLLSDGWESDSIELAPSAVADAITAFGAKDIDKLRAIWAAG